MKLRDEYLASRSFAKIDTAWGGFRAVMPGLTSQHKNNQICTE